MRHNYDINILLTFTNFNLHSYCSLFYLTYLNYFLPYRDQQGWTNCVTILKNTILQNIEPLIRKILYTWYWYVDIPNYYQPPVELFPAKCTYSSSNNASLTQNVSNQSKSQVTFSGAATLCSYQISLPVWSYLTICKSLLERKITLAT